jgi:hypothetical protein
MISIMRGDFTTAAHENLLILFAPFTIGIIFAIKKRQGSGLYFKGSLGSVFLLVIFFTILRNQPGSLLHP